MPETILNVTTENCRFVGEIIDAGVNQFVEKLSDANILINWACIENGDVLHNGSRASGAYSASNLNGWQSIPPIDLAKLTVRYDIVEAVAPLAVPLAFVLLPIAWIYLYRRGASTREMLFWGAIAAALPILGPLVTMIFYRRPADNLLS